MSASICLLCKSRLTDADVYNDDDDDDTILSIFLSLPLSLSNLLGRAQLVIAR